MPREKALSYGFNSLSENELIALILKSAYKGSNVFILADELIKKANGFSNLLSLKYEELIDIKGIKKAKALEIMAILEICKRLTRIDKVSENKMVLNPDKVIDYLRFKIGYGNQEEFFVVFVDNKSKILKAKTMYKGTNDRTYVGIDEILREALLLKAKGIIISHNHPSGDTSPSDADIELTKNIAEGCRHIGISFIDHIIVSKSSYYSFKSSGILLK